MSAETYTSAGLVVPTGEPVVLVGEEVPELLPGKTLDSFARDIEKGLIPYANIMGQMNAMQVRHEMDAGNFALRLAPDPQSITLLATARDAGRLNDPQDLDIPLPEETRVVGTWLKLNGTRSGRIILNAAADLAASRPGANAVVAIVGERNPEGIEAMERAGGVRVGTRLSEKVKTPDGGGAPVIIFQLRGKSL